jgi:hypothetical protein
MNEFIKKIRLLNGRHETIKTRFEKWGIGVVEHVELETHDRPTGRTEVPAAPPAKRTR